MNEIKAVVELPEALWEMMHECEAHCVAGCCGRSAFEIDHQAIRLWADGDVTALNHCREHINQVIAQFTDKDGLYHILEFDDQTIGSDWIAWFNEWKIAVEQALNDLS